MASAPLQENKEKCPEWHYNPQRFLQIIGV
jgi:hypothetical protein